LIHSEFELIVIAFLTSDPCPSPFSFLKTQQNRQTGHQKWEVDCRISIPHSRIGELGSFNEKG
jgi:hypothetical protein